MQNHWLGRKLLAQVGPPAILGMAGLGAVWLWQANGFRAQPLVAGMLAAAALGGIVWQFQTRAKRRLHAALDAYAANEMARALPRNATKKPTFFAAKNKRAAGGRSFDRGSQQRERAYSRREMYARPQSQNR